MDQFQRDCESTAVYEKSVEDLLQPLTDLLDEYESNQITETSQKARDRLAYLSRLLRLCYTVMGLAGEAGEVANKAKKILRDGKDFHTIRDELGDTLYYVSAVATELCLSLSNVAHSLTVKLFSRKDRGVLKGDGDNR